MIQESLKDLELIRLIADRYKLDSSELRPCVARMLNGNHNPLGLKREHIAFMVAVDLKNAGITEPDIEKILYDSKIAAASHIRSALQSTKLDRYKRWNCSSNTMKFDLDQIRQNFCVEKENCLWYKQHEGIWKRKFKDDEDKKFEKYGWHHICSAYEYVLYIQIRELEHIHDAGTGGLVIATHDKLAFMVGCSRRHVGTLLKKLVSLGLIIYEVGDPTRKKKMASRIQRVIPVPEPSPKHNYNLKEFEQFSRLGRID